MKTLINTNFAKALITAILILGLALLGKAQKQKLTILNIDVSNVELDPIQAGNLVRLEMEKIDTFEITDRYDVNYLIKKKNLNIEDCYGKICQVEVGKELGSDLMLSGTIEKISKTIVVSLRLIDVEKEKIIRSHVAEYLVIPEELQTMVQVSIRRLLDVNVSDAVEAKLTKEVLTVFLNQQQTMLKLLNQARSISLNKTKTSISISKLIKLKLGDTFRVVIYHNQRHLMQAFKAADI